MSEAKESANPTPCWQRAAWPLGASGEAWPLPLALVAPQPATARATLAVTTARKIPARDPETQNMSPPFDTVTPNPAARLSALSSCPLAREFVGFSFAVADAHTDEAVGQIGLWTRDIETGSATTGYWVAQVRVQLPPTPGVSAAPPPWSRTARGRRLVAWPLLKTQSGMRRSAGAAG